MREVTGWEMYRSVRLIPAWGFDFVPEVQP